MSRNPSPDQETRIYLQSRVVLRVEGMDAESFLQNIFTNDIKKIVDGYLQYNLLLSPQGQILHDVFIFRREECFYVDVDRDRKEDLLRRLKIFKLRAQVIITETDMRVYADESGLDDPRLDDLPKRLYRLENLPTHKDEQAYIDKSIQLGIPVTSAIRYEKDFAHDINLDTLNAIAWDKGCFIGQEVAARVHNRGLAKKRLYKVSADALIVGQSLQNEKGAVVGDIRVVDSTGTQALALIRKDSVTGILKTESAESIAIA